MITHGFYITRLHHITRDVTENNGAYIISIFKIVIIELLCILLPNLIILYQVLYFCWNYDFDIGNNIFVTKSSLAATIDVFAHQCHLGLKELYIT